ncbi:GNAT family N-acetyltransferase [Photobacterium sp. DNB22_13_2]
MIRLTAFTEADFDLLISWVPTAEFNHLWGGNRFIFPLDKPQLLSHLQCDEVTAMMLCDEGERVGYVELFRESETTYRVCRVLIGEVSGRGMGYGKKMLELAIDLAWQHFGADQIKLTVFEHNERARLCYESLGFVIDKQEPGFEASNGQIWTSIYMSLSK